MPMRGELSVPRVERHSGRSDNHYHNELLLVAAFCILGLSLSILIAVAGQAAEPENIMLAVKAFG